MKCWWMSSTRSSRSRCAVKQGIEDGRGHFREPGTFGERDHRERQAVGGRQHLGGKPIGRVEPNGDRRDPRRVEACDERSPSSPVPSSVTDVVTTSSSAPTRLEVLGRRCESWALLTCLVIPPAPAATTAPRKGHRVHHRADVERSPHTTTLARPAGRADLRCNGGAGSAEPNTTLVRRR